MILGFGFSRIFLESGLKLTTSFLEKNLVDDFSLFISNKELKDKLKVRYENHGFDGEKDIIVPIMYDPDTGNIYDVGDIYDIKGEEDVHGIEQVKVQN